MGQMKLVAMSGEPVKGKRFRKPTKKKAKKREKKERAGRDALQQKT